MSKNNTASLRLANSLYGHESIKLAVEEFSEISEIRLLRNKKYTEVIFADNEDLNVLFEFANYALFLTIQSK